MTLNRLGQQLDERQPSRYPTEDHWLQSEAGLIRIRLAVLLCLRSTVEAARQFVEREAEALFHLRQQPALFKRAFLWTHSLRAR